MALFSRKQTNTKEVAVVASTTPKALPTDYNLASVVEKPLITEKSVMQGEHRVYVFLIRKDATKYMVRDAIAAIYKVTPVKVNIVNKLPRKGMSRSRGRVVSESGYKKAYVYLKAGDTINLI
jgi:large subunit ribosomal protein L23